MFHVSLRVSSSILSPRLRFDDRSAEELVVPAVAARDGNARIWLLMVTGAPPHLQGRLGNARHGRYGDGIGAQGAARGGYGIAATDGEVTFPQHVHRLPLRRQSRRLDRVEFRVAERRVEFRDIDLARRVLNAGHPVSALERLAERMCVRVIRDGIVAHAVTQVVALRAMRYTGDPHRIHLMIADIAL